MAFSDYFGNPNFTVGGKSVSDLLTLDPDDFVYMDESNVRKIVGRLVSAGNKRLRAFERQGEKSPAYNRAMESGGAFSTKGKTFDELQEEFARAREFFQSPSGSVRDWKRQTKAIAKLWKENVDRAKEQDVEKIDTDKLKWEIFEKLRKHDPRFAEKSMKYETIAEIETQISTFENDGLDPRLLKADYYIAKLQRDLFTKYEENEMLNNEFDAATSSFFQL